MAAKAARRPLWRQLLRSMRFTLLAFAALLLLAYSALHLGYHSLLRNAQQTGVTLSRIYAAEESNNLAVYGTLLTFGTTSLDRRVEDGTPHDSLTEWMLLYFERVEQVLGGNVVSAYAVLDGEIFAADPWEGDAVYDYEQTEWYRRAVEAGGDIVFTGAYHDVVTGAPIITAAQQSRHGAVIAFDIYLEQLPFSTIDLQEGGSFFLCDAEGAVLYQQTDLEWPEAGRQKYLAELIALAESGALEGYEAAVRDLDGRQRGVYYTRMSNGWYSFVTLPYSSILGSLVWFILAFVTAMALLFAVLTFISWRDVRLRARIQRADETVRALGNSYYALYRINFVKDTYEMIKGSEYVKAQLPPSGGYGELLRVAGEVMEPDAFRDFRKSFSRESLRDLVRQKSKDFGGDFLRRFGSEYRWVNVRVLFDDSLPPEEAVLSFREVGAEKQRQLRERKLLEDSLALARQNEESKQAFFRNMSHDMRTPLNGILSSSRLAAEHRDDPERLAGYLRNIDTSSRYLLDLINDILDMSRMEQGKIVLDNQSFSLRNCMEDCLAPFRAQAESDGKILKTDLPPGDALLLGDPFRVQQVLNNLLSNALKFTPEGGVISVSVRALARGEHSRFQFVVEDTGIGMSEEFLGRLFEPYAREMRFSAQQAAGTGLGMSITKNLISLMGGEIHVESAPGKGSRFTVVLPFTGAPEEPEAPAQEAFSLEGLRLLLAEDNDMNRALAAELLASQGASVTPARDGEEAVAKFEESGLFFFDAILMDMQMPVLDGCGAARRIRALGRPGAKAVAIVAVTANAFAEDIAATTAAGMDAHISKPIDFRALKETLGGLLRRRDGV